MKRVFCISLLSSILMSGVACADYSIDKACKVVAKAEACNMTTSSLMNNLNDYITRQSGGSMGLRASYTGGFKGCLMVQRPLMIEENQNGGRSFCKKTAIEIDDVTFELLK